MVNVGVPNLGQKLSFKGRWRYPGISGDVLIYEMTDAQANHWSLLSPQAKGDLIWRANAEVKDLRELLS